MPMLNDEVAKSLKHRPDMVRTHHLEIRNSNATDKPTHDVKETTHTYDVLVPAG